jgi:hypothetical protein
VVEIVVVETAAIIEAVIIEVEIEDRAHRAIEAHVHKVETEDHAHKGIDPRAIGRSVHLVSHVLSRHLLTRVPPRQQSLP